MCVSMKTVLLVSFKDIPKQGSRNFQCGHQPCKGVFGFDVQTEL